VRARAALGALGGLVLRTIGTLVGVTALLFALVALSPGGLMGGASAGAGDDASARLRAQLDDRYGLDSPAAVQYGRWLAGLSPVKFGTRPRVGPGGEVVRVPRSLRGAAAIDAGARDEVGAADAAGADEWSRYLQLADQEALARARALDSGDELAVREAEVARRKLAAWIDASSLERAGVGVVPGVVWLGWPELGRSRLSGLRVEKMVGAALPLTLVVNVLSLGVAAGAGVGLGVLMARRPGGASERVAGPLLSAAYAAPAVLVCTLAIALLAGPDGLALFPLAGVESAGSRELPLLPGLDSKGFWSAGLLADWAWHLALPVACLALPMITVIARHTRATALEQLASDHVRAARARGVGGAGLWVWHVLRPGAAPLLALAAAMLPGLVAGSVVVERAFSLPGMGGLLLTAALQRDTEVLLACAAVSTCVVVLVGAACRGMQWLADPRVREDLGAAA